MITVANHPAPTADVEAATAVDHLGVRMTFARDEEIYAQEEEADLIYRVVQGAVRTIRLMDDGRRQVGDFYYPGDVFGIEPWGTHLYSAEALSNCVIQVLRRSALAAEGRLESLIISAATRELQRTQDHVLLLGRKTACEKVATLLNGVAARAVGERAELQMSRQDMADYLGLTIETVSRMLSQLQASSIIEFLGLRHFRIRNPQALARLAA